MTAPYTAQGVNRMFPGTLGGRSRIATPREKPRMQPKKRLLVVPRVWGISGDTYTDDLWIAADGSAIGPLVPIPGSTDDGVWYGGGSDGLFHYHAALVSGELVVLKFSLTLSTLLDTWGTGFMVGGSPEPVPNVLIQHVCANDSRVVVVCDLQTSGSEVGIGVAVFDLSGALLDTFTYATSGPQQLSFRSVTGSGSATDGDFVYFWMDDTSGDISFPGTQARLVKVDLSDGTLTPLFWGFDNFASTGHVTSISVGAGLVVAPDGTGDIIFATEVGSCRMTQAGGFVWNAINGTDDVNAIAHSGLGGIWLFPVEGAAQYARDYFDDTGSGAIHSIFPLPAQPQHAWFPGGTPAPDTGLERVSTPELGETLLGVAGDSLYTITEDVGAGDALIYRYLLADITTDPSTVSPVETFTASALLDGVFDDMGQQTVDDNGDLYQWRYNSGSDDFDLQRWVQSGSTYVLDDPAVTSGHYSEVGHSFNPHDGLLYVAQWEANSGGGYPPTPVRTVVPSSGVTVDFSDSDVDPDSYHSAVGPPDAGPFPLFASDGSVWVPWYDSGTDGGFFYMASDGSTSQLNFGAPFYNWSQMYWFGLPYGGDRLLVVDLVDELPWIIDAFGNVTQARDSASVAFAQVVADTASFNFVDRVVYGGGHAWVFLSDQAQLWRAPF